MKNLNHIKRLLPLILLLAFINNSVLAKTVNKPLAKPSAVAPSKHHLSAQKTDSHIWNFQDANIRDVIIAVAKITHKNFVIDPRVQGKVTLVSAKPIENSQIYPMFLSVLNVLGYQAVAKGRVINIIPDDLARFSAVPVNSNQPLTTDATVIKIIKLKYINAQSLIPTLTPLLPATSSISAYVPTNTLVIAGRASNINKILQVISSVDNQERDNFAIVHLKHAVASNIVGSLSSFMKQFKDNNVEIAALSRSNSVLISGNRYQRIRYSLLLKELDNDNMTDSSNTEVIYLHYRKASSLLPILMNIARAAYGNHIAANLSNNNIEDNDNAVTGKTAKQLTSPNIQTTINNTEKVEVSLTQDPTLNAIIITAPPLLRRIIRQTLSRLDIRPAQVLVQAIVVEVTQNRLQQLGIEWGTAADGASDGTPFSTLTGGLGIGFIKRGDIRLLLQALENDNSSNVLSTPSLVVLDNHKAAIKIGKMVPFQTAAYQTNNNASESNTPTPYSQFDRKFVGLELSVTPQINQGDAVELNIQQGNEDIVSESADNNLNPRTDKSSIQTKVLVNNGEILVLGGLIQNQHAIVTQKVPILSGIPLIGNAFKTTKDTIEKRNLLVFLRPIIITNQRISD